ncbi:MAG: formylglycine-generating enzyme family protein [Planctomycetia bacterium]|nr:formylglycine-generating enzyme family protein [Planctomycetia bacterium]
MMKYHFLFLSLFFLFLVMPIWAETPTAGTLMIKTVNGIEYRFRWCPPGEFLMGSADTDKEAFRYEKPQHPVRFREGFWILETEVTQEMWFSVMGTNSSTFQGKKYPIEYVSWYECVDFCNAISEKLRESGMVEKSEESENFNVSVKLPTEAQWEYACRSGTKTPYSGTLAKIAWYGENLDSGSSHEVAQKKQNAWGIYDMHGNVSEWCSDFYYDSYLDLAGEVTSDSSHTKMEKKKDKRRRTSEDNAKSSLSADLTAKERADWLQNASVPQLLMRGIEGKLTPYDSWNSVEEDKKIYENEVQSIPDLIVWENPAGPKTGIERVVRGGWWGSSARFCRSASRDYFMPTFRDRSLGFRIMLVFENATTSETSHSSDASDVSGGTSILDTQEIPEEK